MKVERLNNLASLSELPLTQEALSFAKGWWSRTRRGPWQAVMLGLVDGADAAGLLLGRVADGVLHCDYFNSGKVASPDVATYLLMGYMKNDETISDVGQVILDETQCTNVSVHQALAVMGLNKAGQAIIGPEKPIASEALLQVS